MKSIILAGGLGTRLRPLTYEIPKPLIPIQKKPLLNHLISFLENHTSEIGVIISGAHKPDFDRWLKHWQDDLANSKITLFLEEKPAGTFGCLRLIKDWVGSEDFMVTNGDELMEFDLASFLEFHKQHKPVTSMVLMSPPDSKGYNSLSLEGHVIKNYLYDPEKTSSKLISAGFYAFSPSIFEYDDLSKDVISIEHNIFPNVAKDGKCFGFVALEGRFFDCGTFERWEKAMKEW